MVESSFGWLDYDDRDRRAMMELVNLFREQGTLDELGIGTIRDTFADHFFPGTSTLQTHVRYFLFVPWIYQELERARTSSSRAAERSRELQYQLVQSLKAGSPNSETGIIGISAGERLRRPPSSIYWFGLGRWGIRLFDGSDWQYHASLDAFYRAQKPNRLSEGGELVEEGHRNWHGSLPSAPSGLFDKTDFNLSSEEAEYLAERIRQHCPRSLLSICLSASRNQLSDIRNVWDLKTLSLSPDLVEDVEHARRFAVLTQGASLVYNLMAAELAAERALSTGDDNVDRYRQDLHVWADQLIGSLDDYLNWDLSRFEARLRMINRGVSQRALDFFWTWTGIALAQPRTVLDDPVARQLIRQRERVLKGPQARLHSPRALEQWSGASGLGLLNYRWGGSKQMLLEVATGMRRQSVLF